MTDQLLSSAFSQLKNISSDVVDLKETITNIEENVADIKVELPPIGSIIAWLPTIALPEDLPGRERAGKAGAISHNYFPFNATY